MHRFVTLEEHYLSTKLCKSQGHDAVLQDSFPPQVHHKLLDLDSQRLQDMEDGQVQVQVMSHIPLSASTSEVIEANDLLADAVKLHPFRLAGFALLNMADPAAAAAELERCCRDLGFKGALIGNNTEEGDFFDTERFDPLWDMAQHLGVPVYLHPTYPSAEHRSLLYAGPWDARMELNLGGWCWGWHSLVGLHFLRLYAAGVFERFPRLKVILGHMGEMVPFMLDRICPISLHWPGSEGRTRTLRETWESNVWVTTSGMFSLAPMKCLLDTTSHDRILYSVDYPLASNKQGLEFMNTLEQSGLVNPEQWKDIAYGNAARLLNLKLDE